MHGYHIYGMLLVMVEFFIADERLEPLPIMSIAGLA